MNLKMYECSQGSVLLLLVPAQCQHTKLYALHQPQASERVGLTYNSYLLSAARAAVHQALFQHSTCCCQWLTECRLGICQGIWHNVKVAGWQGDELCKAPWPVDDA